MDLQLKLIVPFSMFSLTVLTCPTVKMQLCFALFVVVLLPPASLRISASSLPFAVVTSALITDLCELFRRRKEEGDTGILDGDRREDIICNEIALLIAVRQGQALKIPLLNTTTTMVHPSCSWILRALPTLAACLPSR